MSEVHLWHWNLDAPGAGGPEDRALLSPAEQARADKFLVPHGARRFTAGRAALRRTVAEVCNRPAASLVLKAGPTGKPFIEGGPDFNLSHSGPAALFAMAPFPIGVDIEAIRSLEDGIARLVFTGSELAELAEADDRQVSFFRGWTRKEAVVKARGGSLADMKRFSVSLGVVGAVIGEDRWTVTDVAAPPGYAAAVAGAGRGWRVISIGAGRESVVGLDPLLSRNGPK